MAVVDCYCEIDDGFEFELDSLFGVEEIVQLLPLLRSNARVVNGRNVAVDIAVVVADSDVSPFPLGYFVAVAAVSVVAIEMKEVIVVVENEAEIAMAVAMTFDPVFVFGEVDIFS